MKKITFDIQCLIILILLGLAHLAAYFTKMEFLTNAAWIIGGMMFLLNPVWPASWGQSSSKRKKLESRIAGVLLIVMGIWIRT